MHRLLVIFAIAVSSACGAFSRPVSNSYESPEALARAVLSAVERRDANALGALALNKEDFGEHVWPELPAARPERNLSVNFVWGDLNQKSNVTLRDTLAVHGGKTYEFISIRFLGDTTAYKSYRVHRESELTVRDADGTEQQLRMFGSVLEKDGRYKVFSYVVDD
jgi:hypothetical protein